MTEAQIPWNGATFFKVVCRLGINRRDDVTDPDRNPNLMAIGGTVQFSSAVPKFKYVEADGRSRMVVLPNLLYNIDTNTGELTDGENVGVYLMDTDSSGVNPSSFTYSALIKPSVGNSWPVVFSGHQPSGEIDLIAATDTSLSPSFGESPSTAAEIAGLKSQLAALQLAGGGLVGSPWRAGNWYLGGGLVGTSSFNTTALAAGTLYAIPFNTATSVSLSRVAIVVSTAGAAATVGRVIVYRASATAAAMFGQRVGYTATIDVSTGGTKETSLPLTLAPGYYWIGFVTNATTLCVRAISGIGPTAPGLFTPRPSAASDWYPNSQSPGLAVATGFTAGSIPPDPAPSNGGFGTLPGGGSSDTICLNVQVA